MLPPDDAAALVERAERVSVASGDWAHQKSPKPMLWLPETAVLSFGEMLGDRAAECGMVGREGAVGWEPVTGLDATRQPIGVLIGGTALSVDVSHVATICEARPRLAAALLRFREVLIAQLRLTVAMRMQCRPDARLARWLCMLHDRVDGDTLDITHLRVAAFLHARRASITDCLHVLEGERVIRCTRGKIQVRDRSALEIAADGSYGPPEAAYRSLIGPFGKSLRAGPTAA